MTDIPGCYGCATPFTSVQIWLSHHLHNHPTIVAIMKSKYGWHACETLHFFGLSLLVGTIGVFDMRVLGIAKRIPIPSLQRLQIYGIAGFALNTVITGFMFLIAFPNQYLYQWPFWIKLSAILLAELQRSVFDLIVMRKIEALKPGDNAPRDGSIHVRCTSLVLWITVIFAGRFLAFYKPLFTLPAP